MTWIDLRESDHWALISGSCLASDIHAWVAHQVLMRNNERKMMKSNSLDGEFIRLLSGTHHVAASFKRAGLCKGDLTAWIVDLSGEEEQDMFAEHAKRMNFKVLADRPNLSIFDAKRMGIELGENEDAAIGHIHLADLR
jgi:tRNA threonylcarbamoyladenosine modification (KEOPS) complex Cgi121 subunit